VGDLILTILVCAVAVTAIGTLGSGIYFFVSGAKANEAEARLFNSEAQLNRARVESAQTANRVANEMGRKLASVDGLGEFAIGFEKAREICGCDNCQARRGEGND